MMKQILKIKEELCVGCRICEMACSLKKTNSLSPFKSGIWVVRDDFKGIDRPVVCRQCKEPLCVKVCPLENDKPIRKDKLTGIVQIAYDKKCADCHKCVDACPFKAVRIDPEDSKLIKCDLCGGVPECVEWCYFGALAYGDQDHLRGEKAKRR